MRSTLLGQPAKVSYAVVVAVLKVAVSACQVAIAVAVFRVRIGLSGVQQRDERFDGCFDAVAG
ncbi:hypothetical protein JF546_07895 [Nitratireductor aquimarinus]|uniref:hypothetical protein n=1 Tax=Nitratireductor aquimarinus TaxID=889300 RepID=UPI001A8D8604|nr:hypothetical protein [Nitratireductor aquimarinus]MBN8242927.1 hypothetical protein [Nitratireductor aquimarinus]MBY6132027.1 hypothetical protein [Nitratireductor aquimarinus]MCA1301563.1 hypothetical protein [Nitratireductor aquimarinus]